MEDSLSGVFNLTAVKPHNLDYMTQYPVLAIRTTYTQMGQTRIGVKLSSSRAGDFLFDRKQIIAKDAGFLTADQDGRFKWVSPQESSLFKPQLAALYPPERHKRLTRYSVEENLGEDMNMIYPVRSFSITSIDMEGFDPGKEYPVLAIDIDKYLPEEGLDEVDHPEEQQSETMAFFLVGDDNGEFTWIGEDQCKLYPL
jgi:hypothetical protein